MVEKLREKTGISYDAAREALENNNWDLIDTIIVLDKQGRVVEDAAASNDANAPKPVRAIDASKAGKKLKNALKWVLGIIKKGEAIRIGICRGEEEIGSLSITDDQNYRGKVNLDEMPWPLVSRFLPGILEWGLKPWVVSGDSFDFTNLYSSMEITVPSTYSVYLNGKPLGEEYIVADGIHYDIYEDYYYDLPNLPTKVTYRFDNVIGDVNVEIRDEDGNVVNIDPNKGDVQFVKPVDEETQQRLMALMEPFTEKYLVFRSGATDSGLALANLKPYIIPGSDIDKRAQNALDGLSWAHTNSFKLTDYKFNGVLPLMNGCYVCSVTATTDTYTYGKGEVTDIMELNVIVYDDGETTLAFQVN